MRISFVLPVAPVHPGGGTRVVYEYANHLVRRGHDVVVTYPRWRPPARRELIRRSYWRSLPQAWAFAGPPRWLAVDPAVRSLRLPTLSSEHLPAADAVIATGWQTARPVSDANGAAGAKFQLVQHYETWAGPPAAVDASLRLPLHKIAIARWLREVVERVSPGAPVSYVPNGIDLDTFRCVVAPPERAGERVAMLYHRAPWKGGEVGLEALRIAHAQRPDIRAELFGTMQPPSRLPDWMCFRGRLDGPGLRRLYNDAGVFLHSSFSEGWGLPASEAMACGCALVATDNPGVLDYAEPDRTALIAPRGDPRSLGNAIATLVSDDALRWRLADAGRAAIGDYTWTRAVTSLEAVLSS